MVEALEFYPRQLLCPHGICLVSSPDYCQDMIRLTLSSIDAATVTWGPMNEQLGFSYDILNDSYAAGCGTLCIGGVFLIPFALKFGRRPVYIISTVIQLAVSVWSAKLQTIVDLMLVNVFNCFIGALAEVMVQMSVADMYFVHQRGLMNTVYYWVMMTGSSLAPLAGGYITLSQGWRWIWWWMAILFGVGLVAFVFLYEETMYPRPAAPLTDGLEVDIHEPPGSNAFSTKNLKDSKPIDTKTATATLSQPTVVESSVNYDHYIPPRKSYWQIIAPWTVSEVPFDQLIKHMYEPFIIMFTFPAVFFMALEYGLLMACSNLTVTTLSSVMTLPPYNFGTAQIGLMGLPPFIGTSLASLICGPLSDSIALFLAKRRNGVYEPEMRLWLALAFALFVPAGMFMFGIGLQRGTHWILPALGMGVMSFGAVPASSSALTYLTDSYTEVCP